MYAFDVTPENFQEQVIKASATAPVVVDFWAPWCGPCQVLKPLLEKLADEYQGRFLLARVNADENQALAQQFDVRSIPSVKAVYQGRLINEFNGAMPETGLRAWLNAIIPSPGEELRRQARAARERGDLAQAAQLLEQAEALDPDNGNIKVDLAEMAFAAGDYAAAKACLELLPVARRLDADVSTLLTRIEMAQSSKDLPEAATLEQAVAAAPDDLQSRLQLAEVYAAQHHFEPALEHLMEILSRNRLFQDEIARKKMLDIFTILGDQHPLVRSYRRRLMTLLT